MPGPRDRILHLLKTKGPLGAADLARRLGVTAMAVRQHLAALEADGLVAYEEERGGVGRPRRIWAPTPAADERFPDSHGELAVGMIAAARAAFGEKGLAALIAARTRAQTAAYRARIHRRGTLAERVAALAAIRREEGYLAEAAAGPGGSWLLTENHCPICAAARACQGLCAGELALFAAVLGRGVRVERTEHLLDGARRCVYRIRGPR